jgi:hypothetical protein
MSIVSTLETILLSVLPVFTEPGGKLFIRLVMGWILCPSRHTVTGLLPYADPDGRRSHDAYHRFFRAGAWCTDALFRAWATVLIRGICPTGPSASTDFFTLCPPKHSGRNSRCHLFKPSRGPHNVRKSTPPKHQNILPTAL